jgi:hypothetical protein
MVWIIIEFALVTLGIAIFIRGARLRPLGLILVVVGYGMAAKDILNAFFHFGRIMDALVILVIGFLLLSGLFRLQKPGMSK